MEQKSQFEHQLDPEDIISPIQTPMPNRNLCLSRKPSTDFFGVRTATSM